MKYSPGMENVYYVEETNDISEELKKVLEPWPYKLEKSVDTFLDSMPTSYKSRALLIFEENGQLVLRGAITVDNSNVFSVSQHNPLVTLAFTDVKSLCHLFGRNLCFIYFCLLSLITEYINLIFQY